jgi:uncharacterized protein
VYKDSSIHKLILGTVQFGLNYGINNKFGKPTQQAVNEIFNYALSKGINVIDTADAYGNASDLIGYFHRIGQGQYNVITKFKDIGEEFDIKSWFSYTSERLNIPSLYACMFHSVQDYFANPKLLDKLLVLHQQGLIENIGVSIYTNEHFENVINEPHIHIIQLPYNLLDNHHQRGTLIRKAKKYGKIIHVRSVFLQGLFFMDTSMLPTKLQLLKKELDFLKKLSMDYKVSMHTLALNYVASNEAIDGILIGIDNLQQLKANIDAVSTPIPQELINMVDNIATKHVELLNPTYWS